MNDLLFLICGYTSTHRLKLLFNNSFGSTRSKKHNQRIETQQ